MGILDFFGLGSGAPRPAAPSSDADTLRRISSALDAMPPERARHLAAFAYLLSRVANADMKITDDETREMERIVRERGALTEEQAILVVRIARSQNELFGGVDNFLVAREFEQIATREEKIALLHCLFAVSATDRSVSSAEDGTIRKIASELRLDHSDFIEVKSAYRDRLAVLRKPADEGGAA